MAHHGSSWRIGRAIAAVAFLCAANFVCLALRANRTTSALILLLGVLGFATAADRILALVCGVTATLALEYDYISSPDGFGVTTLVTAVAMLLTALIGSELSIRAQRRADEAEHRRREMEELHQFSASLLGAHSVTEAAEIAVRCVTELFGASCAVLHTENSEFAYPSGCAGYMSKTTVRIPIRYGVHSALLEFSAPAPSPEVQTALGNLLGLVFDRARGFEEYARIETARRGDELRETIIDAVAHDFRTPLTSIKAAASALRSSSVAIFEADRELVAVINEEAARLENMIRESLAIARLNTLGESVFEACSVQAIVASATSRLAQNLAGRHLEIAIPDDLPPICGERYLLEVMLFQVIENAWKYSMPGARISISARNQENFLVISVWNEGLRIPDYEKVRIFDKFYRGNGDRGRTEGSGLGLAIAKKIAEAHRGTLCLDDRPDGVCFQFTLPAGQAETHVPESHDFID